MALLASVAILATSLPPGSVVVVGLPYEVPCTNSYPKYEVWSKVIFFWRRIPLRHWDGWNIWLLRKRHESRIIWLSLFFTRANISSVSMSGNSFMKETVNTFWVGYRHDVLNFQRTFGFCKIWIFEKKNIFFGKKIDFWKILWNILETFILIFRKVSAFWKQIRIFSDLENFRIFRKNWILVIFLDLGKFRIWME